MDDDRKVIARCISLGAGVQSSTLLMMANYGEVGPLPDWAIFADTQWEPPAIYHHLDWLHEASTKIPIHTVTHANLRDKTYAREGAYGNAQSIDIPAFVMGRGGKKGMVKRQCTSNFKIKPIRLKLRELCGMSARSRLPTGYVIEQWMGITTDEAHRMRESDVQFLVNRYPLIELGMSRADCMNWWREHFPDKALEKSSC